VRPEACVAPDQEVVARVRAGEVDLFEVLMRRYNQKLYRAARSVFPNDPSEAEDIVQDAWVRAFEHLDQFEGRAQLSTWLVRITLHEAWSRARRRRRLGSLDDSPEEEAAMQAATPGPDPEKDASALEMRVFLEEAVAALPENYRTVFVLRSIEDMSTEETAECLDLSSDVVKTRLHRARGLLRRELLARAGSSVAALYPFADAHCDRIVSGVLTHVAARKAAESFPGPAGPVRGGG
jgi:RNA polymerase sigma-70 factor (ECF subfamily)